MAERNHITRELIQGTIQRLLVEELEGDPAVIDKADAGTALLGRGIGLDSIEALRLGLGLEHAFDIRIPDQDLTVDLFASLGALTEYVYQKVNERVKERI